MKHFFMLIGMFIKLFPWSPLLHYSEKFDFVVGGCNELLHKTASNFLFNLTNILSLIDNLHTITSLLSAVNFVAVLIW